MRLFSLLACVRVGKPLRKPPLELKIVSLLFWPRSREPLALALAEFELALELIWPLKVLSN